MSKNNVVEFAGREEISGPLTEMLRRGARELIQQAVEAELAEFMVPEQWQAGKPLSMPPGFQRRIVAVPTTT